MDQVHKKIFRFICSPFNIFLILLPKIMRSRQCCYELKGVRREAPDNSLGATNKNEVLADCKTVCIGCLEKNC